MKVRPRVIGIALTVLTAALTLSAVPAGVAMADNGTIGSVQTPSWQTNGKVWSIAYTGGVIYAGGDFTSVRPPGNPLGSGEVARSHLVAFDGTTLAPTSFSHTFDGSVYAVAASPDGSRIYVGGTFNKVDGVDHAGVAAFNTSDGSIVSTFSPQVTGGGVRGFAFIGSTVYFGGSFNQVNGQNRSNLAAYSTAGTLSSTWKPSTDGTVFSMAATSDNARVVITGSFDTVNSSAYHAVGALDPSTGATQSWSAKEFPTCSVGKDVIVRGTTVYVAAEGTGGGCFDGTFAVNQSTTQTIWKNNCLGGTQAIEVIGSYLYKGSHAHDCSSDPNGFPQIVKKGDTRHLLAQNLSDGTLGNWWPNTNGKPLGPQAMATDGTRLFLGGDFTTVDTKPQQGFAVFGQDPANFFRPKKPGTPEASSVVSGKVVVSGLSNFDTDDGTLSFLIYRDWTNNSTPPIGSVQLQVRPWNTPTLTFVDTGVSPGSQHTYRIRSTDGVNLSPITPASNQVTVSSAAPQSYKNTVTGDSPYLYWRLADTSGSTVADTSGHNRTGTYSGTVTKGQSGALASDSDKAVLFNGSSGYAYENSSVSNPQTYTIEAWFKTTTNSGGKIIGFGNNKTSLSSSYDRQIYMLNNGKLVYGVYNGSTQTIQSASSYNDGQWHQIAATLGSAGMVFYVDGISVGGSKNTGAQNFNGYWRVGGDQLSGWPNKPSSNFFNGTIDEVSVYSAQLSGAKIYTHYSAGIT
jgi:Concanavalin A-like lectin/glucanases superfamily/Domain of unknown function (DUF5122) beta-propeller